MDADTAKNSSPNNGKLCPPAEPGRWIHVSYIGCLGCLIYVILLPIGGLPNYFPQQTLLAHAALAIVLVSIILEQYFSYGTRVHKQRLEDCSVVEATIVEARTVAPRLTEPEVRPHDYDRKQKELQEEATRLEDIGSECWTEYQILPLSQMLVEFLAIDDLKEQARSSLSDIEEYAIDISYPLDIRRYDRWEERINNKMGEIEKARDQPKGVDPDIAQDDAAEPLRAALRMLLEHVAGYEKYWVEGSAYLRSLITCSAVAIPVFVAMGLLPLWHPGGDGRLDWLHWAQLGIAGALTAVLLDYRRSDVVEVGVTEGRKELWRAVTGSVLGSVAGLLVYGMLLGGLLEGNLFPEVLFSETGSDTLSHAGRSFFWALSAGFTFEKVFERVRGALGPNQ